MIDFYDIDDVLYWFKYIFFLYICVVKTHLCGTESIDNVGLNNDVVIRAYNTDVLVIRDENVISSSDETDSSSDDNLLFD